MYIFFAVGKEPGCREDELRLNPQRNEQSAGKKPSAASPFACSRFLFLCVIASVNLLNLKEIKK